MLALNSNAQKQKPATQFNKNTQTIKFGIGAGFNGIPVEVSYEHGFKDNLFGVSNLNLGLGGYLGYYGYSEDFGNWGKYKYRNYVLGVRGTFHYTFVPKLDTYAGLLLGYDISTSKWDGDEGYDGHADGAGGLVIGGVVGARYQFNPKWGVYAELGYSVAWGTIGISYKL